jgi:hypothetical protein
MKYDRWKRIRTAESDQPPPEPPVPAPGSAWSKLLDFTAKVGKTGIIDTAEARAQAEAFETRRPSSPDDQDLAQLFWVLSKATVIR